jgi:RNA polymerase sigma-70 factor, ECF subfamily
MGEDDARDVARARAGDEDAFKALVERHSRAIFRLAYRMTRNQSDADDVVQEAFIKAFRRIGQFEDRANFGTWLHRIAANCAFDLLRSRARRSEDSLEGDKDAATLEPVGAAPAPDRLAFSSEVRRRVDTAMARLTPTERSAFVLRHHEGLSIEEIGEALGLEASATKHSIFRAVRKMRECLHGMTGALA